MATRGKPATVEANPFADSESFPRTHPPGGRGETGHIGRVGRIAEALNPRQSFPRTSPRTSPGGRGETWSGQPRSRFGLVWAATLLGGFAKHRRRRQPRAEVVGSRRGQVQQRGQVHAGGGAGGGLAGQDRQQRDGRLVLHDPHFILAELGELDRLLDRVGQVAFGVHEAFFERLVGGEDHAGGASRRFHFS